MLMYRFIAFGCMMLNNKQIKQRTPISNIWYYIFFAEDGVQSGSQTMFFVAIILGALGFIACIIIVVCVIHKTRCRCLRRTKIASASTESSTVTLSIDELESCDENYYQKNITKDGIPLVVDTKDTRPTGGKRSLKKNILDKNNENVITIEESEDDRARKCNKRRAKKKSKGANNEAIEDQTQIKGKGHKRLQKGVLSVNDEEQTPESERDDIKNDGSGKKKSGAKKTADNKQRQGKSVAAKMKGKAGNVAREQGQEVEGDSDSGMGDLTIESNTGITSDEDASNRSGKGGKGDVKGLVKNGKISKFGSCLSKQSQGNVKDRSSADSAYLSGNVVDNNLTNAEYIGKSETKPDFLDHSFIARKPKILKHAVEPILEPPAKVELLYEVEPRPTSSRLIFNKSMFLSKASLRVDEVFRE
ncbi:transcriptional regulator ATRX homolog [Mya arenaria]|uniref:transcriptional regulator ATRX homolog n=1 Tax=Mya arenaria TaxID=6604 RepID=UPI0022E289CE|nr:transcriptional regulator ATRX homolog [Mya arenaria]